MDDARDLELLAGEAPHRCLDERPSPAGGAHGDAGHSHGVPHGWAMQRSDAQGIKPASKDGVSFQEVVFDFRHWSSNLSFIIYISKSIRW